MFRGERSEEEFNKVEQALQQQCQNRETHD